MISRYWWWWSCFYPSHLAHCDEIHVRGWSKYLFDVAKYSGNFEVEAFFIPSPLVPSPGITSSRSECCSSKAIGYDPSYRVYEAPSWCYFGQFEVILSLIVRKLLTWSVDWGTRSLRKIRSLGDYNWYQAVPIQSKLTVTSATFDPPRRCQHWPCCDLRAMPSCWTIFLSDRLPVYKLGDRPCIHEFADIWARCSRKRSEHWSSGKAGHGSRGLEHHL